MAGNLIFLIFNIIIGSLSLALVNIAHIKASETMENMIPFNQLPIKKAPILRHENNNSTRDHIFPLRPSKRQLLHLKSFQHIDLKLLFSSREEKHDKTHFKDVEIQGVLVKLRPLETDICASFYTALENLTAIGILAVLGDNFAGGLKAQLQPNEAFYQIYCNGRKNSQCPLFKVSFSPLNK